MPGLKELSVNACSLGLNFIIPPKRNIYMLTKALEDLTRRINDGIPGISRRLVGEIFLEPANHHHLMLSRPRLYMNLKLVLPESG